MPARPLITLTTDFGSNDWFVGALKGVLLQFAPDAQIVDITHHIPPSDIFGAAFALKMAVPWFPPHAVHLAIVDPGVGGTRLPIAVRADNSWFVGPDNGVLSLAFRSFPEADLGAWHIANPALMLPKISRTFHGRDIFAPVAARLATGLPPAELGPELDSITQLDWPAPQVADGSLLGHILWIDRFGNAITSIDETLAATLGARFIAQVGSHIAPVVASYDSVPKLSPLAIFGSSGHLEIALNNGDAARILGLERGAPVRVVPVRDSDDDLPAS